MAERKSKKIGVLCLKQAVKDGKKTGYMTGMIDLGALGEMQIAVFKTPKKRGGTSRTTTLYCQSRSPSKSMSLATSRQMTQFLFSVTVPCSAGDFSYGRIKVLMETDKLLTIEQAAELLTVSKDWLYRDQKWKTLPFTVVLSPRKIRFSLKGLLYWLEEKQNGRKGVSQGEYVLDRVQLPREGVPQDRTDG